MSKPREAALDCRAGVDRRPVSHATQRTRYTVDFHKAPFTGLGLTFAPDPETGEVRAAAYQIYFVSEPASSTSFNWLLAAKLVGSLLQLASVPLAVHSE